MYEDDDRDLFSVRWELENYSFAICETGDAFHSNPFVIDILDDTKWYISIYPKGKEDAEFVAIYLTRWKDDDGGCRIPIIFTIALEASDSTLLESRVSPVSNFEQDSSFGFDRYIRRKTLLQDMKSTFLPNDTLTIHCTLERASTGDPYIKEYIAESYMETVQQKEELAIEKWNETRDILLASKDIHFTGHHQASFRIDISESGEGNQTIVMNLNRLKTKQKKNTSVSCRLSVLDEAESEAIVKTTELVHEKISMDLFHRNDIKDSFLKDGTLRLRCVLDMETGKKRHRRKKIYESKKDEIEDVDGFEDVDAYMEKLLLKDYENMFLSGDFCDVKLRAGGKVVNCHKCILYARSQVLTDLLDKAEESPEEDGTVYIGDVDGDTLEQMIYFLYSDKIKNIKPASAMKLFVAGHKYRIQYLKQKCSSYLSTAFTFENVYDIFTAAHLYEDGDLKRAALGYIAKYFSRICLTAEWENFQRTQEELFSFVCKEIRRIKHM